MDNLTSPDDTLLRDCELELRAFNSLDRDGYRTVGEVRGIEDRELVRIPGIGRKSARHIREVLGPFNAERPLPPRRGKTMTDVSPKHVKSPQAQIDELRERVERLERQVRGEEKVQVETKHADHTTFDEGSANIGRTGERGGD